MKTPCHVTAVCLVALTLIEGTRACHAFWNLYSTGCPLHTMPLHDGALHFAKKTTACHLHI